MKFKTIEFQSRKKEISKQKFEYFFWWSKHFDACDLFFQPLSYINTLNLPQTIYCLVKLVCGKFLRKIPSALWFSLKIWAGLFISNFVPICLGHFWKIASERNWKLVILAFMIFHSLWTIGKFDQQKMSKNVLRFLTLRKLFRLKICFLPYLNWEF